MPWIVAGGAALSAGAGMISANKQYEAMRLQRDRVGRTLKYGRGMYSRRADQALRIFMDALGRSREGTQLALAETTRAGQTGFADLSANLDRQLARTRTGIGGTLAASSFGPGVERGIYSDFRRDVGALNERIGAQRSGIQLRGAQQENQMSAALANALFRRGSAEFDMQQALSGRFGNVAPPQEYDFGELSYELADRFGNPGAPNGGWQQSSVYSDGRIGK